MKTPLSFTLTVNIFGILGCLLFSGCGVVTDPKIYEESAVLIEEIIKDEVK